MSYLIFILPLYVLANVYIIWIIVQWLKNFIHPRVHTWTRVILPVCYGVISGIPVVAFFMPEGKLHKALQKFSNEFFGILIYLFGILAFVHLISLLLRLLRPELKDQPRRNRLRAISGVVVLASTIIVSLYGFHHTKILDTRQYSASIDKRMDGRKELKIVLASDLHMGYSIGSKRIQRMVKQINEQNADLVLFVGDLFDNTVDGIDDKEAVKKALKQIRSTYGCYGSWGNHDIDERLFMGFSVARAKDEKRSAKMGRFMEECGITMLEDETVLVDNSFYLVGRKDYEKAGDGTNHRAALSKLVQGVDGQKPLFLLEHQPRELRLAAQAGVDLMLSGHTHGGQLFPINLVCGLIWENPKGKRLCEQMTSIVSCGVGIYGPDMRIGSRADISFVTIQMKQ